MFLWQRLKETTLPIWIYGMGNGAEKVLAAAKEYQVTIAGIFVSNDHARAITFQGYPIISIDSFMNSCKNAVILVSFGCYEEAVLERIQALTKTYQVYIPDVPLMGGEILTPDAIERRKEEISAAKALLTDEKSHRVFNTMLEVKQTGEFQNLFSEDTLREDDFSLLHLTEQEDYLDLGAYNGDTIQEFLFHTGRKYHKIYAMEPDSHNFHKLCDFNKHLPHIEYINKASWNCETSLTFSGKGGRNCAMVPELPGQYKHLHQVEAIPVDSINYHFSFVKMDVEGAEAETLQGMVETLNKFHPKLLISAYHKPDDFITLPLLLESLCPGYKIFIRRNRCIPAWEIQLYCVWE